MDYVWTMYQINKKKTKNYKPFSAFAGFPDDGSLLLPL